MTMTGPPSLARRVGVLSQLLLLCGVAAPATAQITLDFEDRPLDAAIANGYGGFDSWGGFHAVAEAYGCSVPGGVCATNAGAVPVSVSRQQYFGFVAADFTAWAVYNPLGNVMNTPFSLLATGYSGSSKVFSTMLTVPSGRTRITFVWPKITSVVFVPQAPAWFLMDNFTYVNGETIPPEAVVPEPVTLLLLGPGLVAVGGVRWRRRQRSTLSD
jgi:hypothetical protein